MNYALDVAKMIQWLIPSALRKSVMLAWLNALLAPVKTLHNSFVIFTAATKKDIAVTGQKRILEFHLNRYFGDIQIVDATASAQVYIYLESENSPTYLPKFISGSSVDFIAIVPFGLQSQEVAIRAFLNKYKLPTKRYNIIYL